MQNQEFQRCILECLSLEQNDLEVNPMNEILKPQNDELSKISGADKSEAPKLEAVEYKVLIQEENELLGYPIEYECNDTNAFTYTAIL